MTLIEIIREEFEAVIKTKTGWGKNDVLIAFDKACIAGMIRYAKENKISLD